MSNLVEYIGNQEGLFLPVLSDESVVWEKEKQFAAEQIETSWHAQQYPPPAFFGGF